MRKADLTPYRERFAPECQAAITSAFETASQMRHLQLTPVHLLHGLVRATADQFETLFEGLGSSLAALLAALDEYYTAIPAQAEDVVSRTLPADDDNLELAESCVRTFHLALESSHRAGRGRIEAADLLLGILRSDDEGLLAVLQLISLSPLVLIQAVLRVQRDTDRSKRQIQRKYELPPYLKQFAVNLNQKAAEGELPPLIGRQAELAQMLEVLCHRERSNSVMLIGEAGVGKTAIVEGLAQLLESGDAGIPPRLKDRQILQLHLNSLVAGTMFRGMFEDRMDKILKELRENPNYIVFIDEAHNLVGSGSAVGVPADGANILKGALARGEMQVIGATTYLEYRRYFMDDEALVRRFRVVKVEEPDIETTRTILDGLRPHLKDLYSVDVPTAVVDRALALSQRYKRALRRPDKVIGWLDTACVRTEMRGGKRVSESTLLGVVADDAGIPLPFVQRSTDNGLHDLQLRLSQRVIGQHEAVQKLAARLRLNKGPLKENFTRPDGVFLFLGPTGVGKTELARALAHELFGDADSMIRIDMSEYQAGGLGVEKLIGMPRGIVGSADGGILTSRVQDKPHAVLLLDEVEKADRSVLNLFLQIFDEGWCADGRGKRIWFSDMVIIMTSNLGSDHLRKLESPLGFASVTAMAEVKRAERDVLRDVEQQFSPELLNRIDEIAVFTPLSEDQVVLIARQYIDALIARLAEEGRVIAVTDAAVRWLARDGYSVRFGARHLKRQIDRRLKMPLTDMWSEGRQFSVDIHDGALVIVPERAAAALPGLLPA